MSKDRVCKVCKKTLEVAHSARVFCKKCMAIRVKEKGRKYYHDHRKNKLLSVRKCSTCKNEFVYARGKTKFLKICNGCITMFYARVDCMSCLFCEKPIKLNHRGNHVTLFCSKKCSAKAWYIVKANVKPKKIVLTK